MTTGITTSAIRRLTAALLALLIVGGLLALAPSPAAADGQETCTTTIVYEPKLVLTTSKLGKEQWTYKMSPVPYRSCTVSYDHTHAFCEMWRTQATNPDTVGVDGNVEVGSVGTLICALWVQRGH